MRSNYRSERATVMRTRHPASIKRTITTLLFRVDECERFYPWPALADSWREDIAVLQARLKDLQSK
jgi:hypothetical protein